MLPFKREYVELITALKKDQEILNSLRSGDEGRALSYLYETTLKKVRQFILKSGGDIEKSNDIFQDAVIIFINHVRNNKFNEKNEIDSFVFVVAKNLWLNQLRRNKKSINFNDTNIFESISDYDDQLANLISIEKTTAVNKLFSLLDEKCKKLLHFYNHENLSLKEICEKMGFTSINATKTMHYRCKQNLIKILSENKDIEDILKN